MAISRSNRDDQDSNIFSQVFCLFHSKTKKQEEPAPQFIMEFFEEVKKETFEEVKKEFFKELKMEALEELKKEFFEELKKELLEKKPENILKKETLNEKPVFVLDMKEYIKRESLLTEREAMVYKLLLPYEKDYKLRVFFKVRLFDIVDVKEVEENRQTYINKIIQKHVDFLLCSNDGYRPIAVIEVDDLSHYSQKGQEKDNFINNLLAQTEIKLARIIKRDKNGIQEEIQRLFDTICPYCCGNLYVQTNSKTLDKFWGCENWNGINFTCDYTKSIKNSRKERELFI